MTPTRFYYPQMLAAEHEIAACIKRLKKSGCQKIEPVVDGLVGEQIDSVRLACTEPVSLLFGGPGTGKTTTSNMIIRSFDKAGMRGIVLAPSAKAAKRSNEVINNPNREPLQNELECMTVHRGLKFSPKTNEFTHNLNNPLAFDYVILEEGSMLDCLLASDLFRSIDPTRTRIVIIGDPNQLPSIGPGNVMHDLIYSQVVPKTELIKLHRTGQNSGIAWNARKILEGELPIKNDPVTGVAFNDFYYVHRQTPEETLKFILESVAERIPAQRQLDPVNDIQVLSPGKKSDVGVATLNRKLRELLNPGKDQYGGFRVRDKVINRQNIKQLGIVNGDVGRVLEMTAHGMTVDFGAGAGNDGSGVVEFAEDREHAGGSLHLAYCFTVHSSQGSEFPAVLMPCHMAHFKLLYRNLIYTGVTRAKNLSCVIGDMKALRHAIETSVTDKRVTGLQNWLRAA